MNPNFVVPHRLEPDDDASQFDCGNDILNVWLKTRASQNDRIGATKCFVSTDETDRILGFYALAAGSIIRETAPSRLKRNMPDPIPVVILARLAVDKNTQGQGLGAALLADVHHRVRDAADFIGVRALIVHATDEQAATFYRHFGYRPFPENPLHLFIEVDELRKI